MTSLLFQLLERQKEQLKERWSAGEFTELEQYGTAIKNAKAIGQCEILENLIKLDYETFLGELRDGQ